MMNLNASAGNIANLGRIGTVVSPDLNASGGAQNPKTLDGVISKLAESLTQGGHFDENSPLGKMVAEHLPKTPFGNAMATPDSIKTAVGDLLKDKLGENFGAASNLGASGSVKGGGDPEGGSGDLMSQAVNGLSKASMDGALKSDGDGSTFSDADKPMLQEVADYMDKHSSTYGTPDSGSWSKELKEDNYLDKDETAKFRGALDEVSQKIGQGDSGTGEQTSLQNPLGASTGGGDSSLNTLGGDDGSGAVDGGSQPNQFAQQSTGSSALDIFKQGLQMGLGISGGGGGGASNGMSTGGGGENGGNGFSSGGNGGNGGGSNGLSSQLSSLLPQLQHFDRQNAASQAAENIVALFKQASPEALS